MTNERNRDRDTPGGGGRPDERDDPDRPGSRPEKRLPGQDQQDRDRRRIEEPHRPGQGRRDSDQDAANEQDDDDGRA